MQARFGPFVFDSEARELRRDGVPVHLSTKAFLLLEALLEGRPRALSKAHLRDLLWPNTFVVEANLANLVSELRAVLGDDRRRARFVRTVHGFGYAFLGPVSDLPHAGRTQLRHRLVWGRRVIPLEPGENVLGRGEQVGVCIDAPGISRRHARILVAEGQAHLEDLGSKNGTYLGGRRVKARALLRDGDALRLGREVLAYYSSPLEGTTATQTGGD